MQLDKIARRLQDTPSDELDASVLTVLRRLHGVGKTNANTRAPLAWLKSARGRDAITRASLPARDAPTSGDNDGDVEMKRVEDGTKKNPLQRFLESQSPELNFLNSVHRDRASWSIH